MKPAKPGRAVHADDCHLLTESAPCSCGASLARSTLVRPRCACGHLDVTHRADVGCVAEPRCPCPAYRPQPTTP